MINAVYGTTACHDSGQSFKLRLCANDVWIVYATPRIFFYIRRAVHAEIALVYGYGKCI